jgi:23S rRNA pseudouridine955/2504/2580 synthase
MNSPPSRGPEPRSPKHLTVSDGQAGQRLDNWLFRELKSIPKSHIYRLIRTGQVRVGGGRCRPSYRVQRGDEIRIPPQTAPDLRTPRKSAHAPPDFLLQPLYEDADLLIVNKPAGLAVHGGSGISSGLIERLRDSHPEGEFLELAHRLDRGTSGCLILARSRTVLLELHRALRNREITKSYLGLLAGSPAWKTRSVDQAVARADPAPGTEAAKEARSHFRIVRLWPDCALAEIVIETGRTHQIRIHAASLGHPLAGDPRYGDHALNRRLKSVYGVNGLFLHARSVRLSHPRTHEALFIQAPLPAEHETVLARLDAQPDSQGTG